MVSKESINNYLFNIILFGYSRGHTFKNDNYTGKIFKVITLMKSIFSSHFQRMSHRKSNCTLRK